MILRKGTESPEHARLRLAQEKGAVKNPLTSRLSKSPIRRRSHFVSSKAVNLFAINLLSDPNPIEEKSSSESSFSSSNESEERLIDKNISELSLRGKYNFDLS